MWPPALSMAGLVTLLLSILFAAPVLAQDSCEGLEAAACLQLATDAAYGSAPRPDRAPGLFLEACQAGNVTACQHNQLYAMVSDAAPPPRGSDALVGALQGACHQGSATACYHLGAFFQRGPGEWRDVSQASMLLQRACQSGEGRACYDLARGYASGNGEVVQARALTLYEQACDQGLALGCRDLGELVRAENPGKAKSAYQRGCAAGDALSCKALEGL